MTHDQLGKLFAFLNAVAWAAAMVLFKQGGRSVPPLALNLFKNVVGIVFIVATIAVLAAIGVDAGRSPAAILDPAGRRFWILILSGVIGIAIADTLFFYGLNLAGVGLIAIVDCLYTPFMILFAWLLLGETLKPLHYIGAALILTAVFLSTTHKPPADRTRGQLLLGMALAATAVGLMAFGIVLAKPALEGQPVLWTTMLRMLAGTALLLLLAPVAPGMRATAQTFRPTRIWLVTIPGSFFGAYLAMVFWVAGMAYTSASVAAMLNQCSTVFAILLATLVLREPLTLAKAISLALAFAGVTVVTFHDSVQAWLNSPLGK
jgi:drug/metabolite transporter (DMT)-like permease